MELAPVRKITQQKKAIWRGEMYTNNKIGFVIHK